ncbi:DNA replication/repair protein RecF [uncultured Brachyspira sp.]|uniref:DNA replication/repair protein RecF n=1 Tax=uncultured Brachyspira sp. TaxID=221953 RepID=UPI0025D820DC|nr:DNA replication and repair protein RecF [uncultured Brachyspira sp.]
MILKELTLRSFRNYNENIFEFSDKINVLYGHNGCGKTNILEAIYMLGNGVSFRTRLDRELIKNEKDNYFLRGIFREAELNYDTNIEIAYQKKLKKLFIDKKEIASRKNLIGRILYVIFLPNDTDLIINEPKLRRDYFNMLISSVSREYLSALIKYNKLLKMRNICLNTKPNEAYIYNNDIAKLSIYIADENKKYSKILEEKMNEIYKNIFKNENPYAIKYQSTVEDISNENEYIKKLECTLKEQIRMHTTYFGIHRADYQFFYKDSLSKKFSSQGEKRMFTLIMKLASEKILSEYRKKSPILLIDDAMLELDNIKRCSILEYIKTLGQVFITVTEKEKVKNFENGKIFDIPNIKN